MKKHERYYIQDGNVVFRVEDTLYRIHRSFLIRDSTYFSEMFNTLPLPAEEESAEGSSDENPINMKGQDKAEFECFLSFYYSNHWNQMFKPIKSAEVLTLLKFADKWSFDKPRRAALSWLSKNGTAAERIAVGQLYEDVRKDFIIPALKELAVRNTPLSTAEGELLGMHYVLCLMHSQHRLKDKGHNTYGKLGYPNGVEYADGVVEAVITEVLNGK